MGKRGGTFKESPDRLRNGPCDHRPPLGRRAYQESERVMAAEAYCVKCKTKREIQDAHVIQMKNGRPATEGKCPVCGTKMFKIGAAS